MTDLECSAPHWNTPHRLFTLIKAHQTVWCKLHTRRRLRNTHSNVLYVLKHLAPKIKSTQDVVVLYFSGPMKHRSRITAAVSYCAFAHEGLYVINVYRGVHEVCCYAWHWQSTLPSKARGIIKKLISFFFLFFFFFEETVHNRQQVSSLSTVPLYLNHAGRQLLGDGYWFAKTPF